MLWTAPAASLTFWRFSLSLIGKVPDTEKIDPATYMNVMASAGYEPRVRSGNVCEPFQFWICLICTVVSLTILSTVLFARHQSLDLR